ncbi:hypothetical protein LEP1GSC024_0084 [Leptospira noguchii str. 2001034031]|uniref:Uncharacterized protein n=2 Tax=Leptospira noguchii TaxID=28182 RepID=M6Y943_9LEPT|nr:hypothetical protein LEP1GSC024_0084 [Leptospira noguchii str. 2001034031]
MKYSIYIILFCMGCHWYSVENKTETEKSKDELFIKKTIGVNLDYDYVHSDIDIASEHYRFISLIVPTFIEFQKFKTVKYGSENSDIQMDIKLTWKRSPGSIISILLSSYTLSILPVYYTHKFQIDVDYINSKTQKKIQYSIPTKISFIGYLLYRKSYYDIENKEFVKDIVNQIINKGHQLEVY